VVRPAGFEPAFSVWKTDVLPLDEGSTSWERQESNPRCRIFSPVLYRLSYIPNQEQLAVAVGVEPTSQPFGAVAA
jgi:hypothetical protein